MELHKTECYALESNYCRTAGLSIEPAEAVRNYMRRTVRPEWQRWETLDHAHVSSLEAAGFSSTFIGEITQRGGQRRSENNLRGDFGEVLASLLLSAFYDMEFPWPSFWDRKTPGASLSGADLVGLTEDASGVAFVVGQVKTSAEERYPPTVVRRMDDGLITQLKSLRNNRRIVLGHLKYLFLHCQGRRWEGRLHLAMRRLDDEPTDFLIVGALIRDTRPTQADLESTHCTFAEVAGATVQNYGFYLPVSLVECVQLANPDSEQGEHDAS